MTQLLELRLENCATFTRATLSFEPGFVALTGETGSGKSVAITGLRLALGGRAENSFVRHGAPSARVAAVFGDVDAVVLEFISEHGLPADDLLTVSREITAEGRSGCRVNGALVSQKLLRELGDLLADVSKQGDVRRISSHRYQRQLLDAAGDSNLTGLKERVAHLARRRQELGRQLQDAQRMAAATAVELESARLLVADLEPLHLEAVNLDGLRQERDRLRAANTILGAAAAIAHALGEENSLRDRLVTAADAATPLRHLDANLASLLQETDAVIAALDDLTLTANRFAGTVVGDEARLAECEASLSELDKVRRRFGSLEGAAEALEQARRLLETATGEGHIEALHREYESLSAELAAAASELSRQRRGVARVVEREVTAALRQMELPAAQFRVAFDCIPDAEGIEVDGARVRCTDEGVDEIAFLFAANRGAQPLPLEQAASGGEQSRLLLALAATINDTHAGLLVLDEVDAGIGGETAARVGDLLAKIGRQRQVLVITHRPEIAARAGHHLVVRKQDGTGGVLSTVEALAGDRRPEEIARLMSGRPTAAARARATELLGEAQTKPSIRSPRH